MRIVFTSFAYYPEQSGVPVVTKYLAEGLAKEGHTVHVVTRFNGADLEQETTVNGVKVRRFNIWQNQWKRNRGEIDAYIKYVKSIPKDFLVLECLECQTTDLLLPFLSEMNCKVILHSHGSQSMISGPFKRGNSLKSTIGHTYNFLFRYIYYHFLVPKYCKHIDKAICLSMCGSDVKYLTNHVKSLSFLGNAADDIFVKNFDETSFDVSRLGMTKKKYIVNIANYIDNKRQVEIVEAYASTKLKDYSLLLIGSVKNSYYNKVIERVNKVISTGEKEVLALSGVERSLLPLIVKKASLFILASEHEEYPVTLLESMAVATPFLSTDAGCARLLPGGYTVKDYNELGAWMELMLEDDSLLYSLGKGGREYVKDNCTTEARVQQFCELIFKS